jgi:5-methylcytosine-specific restriction endonuclease McrA
MDQVKISTEFDGKVRKLFLHSCLHCNKPFYAPKHKRRRFCSNSCAHPKQQRTLECALCHKLFERAKSSLPKSKSGFRFCSRPHKDQAQRIESGAALDAMRPDHYGAGESVYREIAFRHHPKQCNRCGYNRYESVLRVHHKDRNRANSAPENLEILCPTCHEEEHFLAGDGLYSRMLV